MCVSYVHPVLRVVAPKRCLLPIDFSVADIADPALCALDLDLFLHNPLLIAAAPANQRVNWPASPKTVETGPHCGGQEG